MNVWVNLDGTRNREFRPLIQEETLAKSVKLYSPNSRGFVYGLYQQAQPTCGTWLDLFNQYPSKTPSEIVDSNGRLHLLKPDYYKHGIRYKDLLENARPTTMTHRRKY